MRFLLFIFLSLTFAACNGGKEKETPKVKEFDNEKYQYLYIPFLNSDIPLPRKFIQVTIEDFLDLQEELIGEGSEAKLWQMREILTLNKESCMAFVDTTNVSCNIVILKNPEFVYLSKDMAKKFIAVTTEALNRNIEQNGGKINETESNYQKFKLFAVGKHSQRITYPEFENHRTTYIVSGERRTFVIFMNTGLKEDIDEVVPYINLREGEF